MVERRDKRRLAAILAADMVGYSRLMAADERGTLARLNNYRQEVIDPTIARHEGRIIKTTGDGMLVEFASVVDAVECAVEVQKLLRRRNTELVPELRPEFRIGINLGDVIVQGDDIFGDGVNIAARLEGIAEPGGIVISRTARDQIKGKLLLTLDDLGQQSLKNIPSPVRAFQVRIGGVTTKPAPAKHAIDWRRPAVAAGLAVALIGVGLALSRPWFGTAPAVVETRPSNIAPAQVVDTPPQARTERSAVAVLPFSNLSGNPEQEYFSDGISDDILTALTQFSGLKVIARNSSFRYKGQNVDIKQVARELGVGYVLEGSVQRDGDKLRITAQLIEGANGTHLWAERYDRPLKDVFVVQDEVTQRVVSSLAAHINKSERQTSIAKAPEKMDAYDLTLQGRNFSMSGGVQNQIKARQAFERAIEIDPSYAPAVARLANVYNGFLINYYNEEYGTPALAERMLATAARAVALAPTDAYARATYGSALTQVGRHDEAVAEIERALRANSNDVDVLQIATAIFFRSGFPERAVEFGAKRLDLDPFQPPSSLPTYGKSLYLAKKYEEAAAISKRCIDLVAIETSCRITRAAALAQLGLVDEARAAVADLLRVQPSYTVGEEIRAMQQRWRRQLDIDHMADGLRKAGVPE